MKGRPVHTASRIQTASSRLGKKPAERTREKKRGRVQKLSKMRVANRRQEVDKRRALTSEALAPNEKVDVGIEETDGEAMEEDSERNPGHIYIQRKKHSNGVPTNSYKIDVRSNGDGEPAKITDCGSFYLEIVQSRCVVCINKAMEVVRKVLSEYADQGSGEGWFKVDNSDITMFTILFNNFMNNYKPY